MINTSKTHSLIEMQLEEEKKEHEHVSDSRNYFELSFPRTSINCNAFAIECALNERNTAQKGMFYRYTMNFFSLQFK